MINKELLSAVLGLHCGIKSIKNSEVIYWFDCIGEIREHSINIYELAHKCKEWAFNKDKYKWLFSYKAFTKCHCDIVDNHNRKYIFVSFAGNNEPEAIFKACEWILTKDSK